MSFFIFIIAAMVLTALITYAVAKAPVWWAQFQNARFQAHLENKFEDWDRQRGIKKESK